MIKRPLPAAAMVIAMAFAFICRFFPVLLMPVITFEDGEQILLAGTLAGIEEKKGELYLYLDSAEAASVEASFTEAGSAEAGFAEAGFVEAGPVEASFTEAGSSKTGSSDPRQQVGTAVLITQIQDAGGLNIRIGNKLLCRCTFEAFRRARNYGNYDEESYYRSSGIFLKAQASDITVSDSRTDVVRQFLYEVKQTLKTSISDAVQDEETAGILTAICTGDRSSLTEETRLLYSHSGIAHILAVSGLHISLIGMTVFRLLRRKLRFPGAAVLSGILMLGFCIMSSASASAVRATIMFLVQIASIGLGKQYDMLSSMSLAAVLTLISTPFLILNSGFILSYAAVLAVTIVYPALADVFLPGHGSKKRRFLSGFLMSLSITLVTLPVTASLYYEIPLYAVLLNLMVIPLMSIVLGAGLASAVTGMISVLMGRFFAAAGVYVVQFIQWVCELLDLLPGSRIITGCPSPARIILYYLLLLAGVGILRLIHVFFCGQRSIKRFPAACTAVFYTAMSLTVLLLRFRSSGLRIYLLDVGQGECILMESPSGLVYMIDAGSVSLEQPVRYRISPALHYLGITKIDYLIVTHPDWDHLSGVFEILEREEGAQDPVYLEVGEILTPQVEGNDHYERLKQDAQAEEIPLTDLRTGLVIQDGALQMTCLHPDKGFVSDDSNAYSAVLDIRYGDFAALTSGDVSREEELELLENARISPPDRGYQLLKTAHHGSAGSSCEEFLNVVSPQTAVISAGKNNPYGHPHEETLERLHRVGADIYVTSVCGEILMEAYSNGNLRLRTMFR